MNITPMLTQQHSNPQILYLTLKSYTDDLVLYGH